MWETLLEWDGAALLWIQEYVRNDFLTPAMKFITHLGDAGMVWIAAGWLFFFLKGKRHVGILIWCSLIGSLIVNNLFLKNTVARIRPYEVVEGLHKMIDAPGGMSFPSGHTGSSFAAAVVIYCMCSGKSGIPAIILAVLMGFTRLYVGVHYPTDVLAGALTGTAIALVVCKIYRKRQKNSC